MKILVVQDQLRSGGTERQSVFLANALRAAAHDVTLLTFRPGGRLAGSVAAGVGRNVLQPFDTTLDWFAPGLGKTATGFSPDIVLCMGRMANCYAGALQQQLPSAVVIATMRTGKRLPWLFRRSLRQVGHVVANSREAADTLVQRYAVPAEKITVIYNSLVFSVPAEGGDNVASAAARDLLRSRHHAGPGTSVLLCVAMFRTEKNQRELIETAAGLPTDTDYQLWLAGDGPSRAACEALAAAKGLSHRVKFVGFHDDPAPLYAAADIAVHASWSDALSNFVIEAQSHGLPAVVYDAQGMRECVVPERTGWVIRRGDRDGFRARLRALMADPVSERQKRSTEARAFARATFDSNRQLKAYLDLFERLKM